MNPCIAACPKDTTQSLGDWLHFDPHVTVLEGLNGAGVDGVPPKICLKVERGPVFETVFFSGY